MRIALIGAIVFLSTLFVLVVGVVTEEERYTTSGAGAEMYIVGTTTNSMIVEPVISHFRETDRYYLVFAVPSLIRPRTRKSCGGGRMMGFFVVAKDTSVCEVGLSESEFQAQIISLGVDRME